MAVYPAHTAQSAGCLPVIVAGTASTADLVSPLRAVTATESPEAEGWLATAMAALPDTATTILVVAGAMPLLSDRTMSSLIECQQRTAAPLVLLSFEREHARPGSRSIVRDSAGNVARIFPEQDAADRVSPEEGMSTGVMCFSRAWLWEHRDAAEALDDGSLLSLAKFALAAGTRIETVRHAGNVGESLYVEDRADLALAEDALRGRVRERAMRGGVTLLDPATVWIDDTVTFGRDITILPNCHLYGETVIGDFCTIGPNARLQDTRLAANVTVMESVLEEAQVGENVRIGPFAHLRPGTVIANDVEIGNYAELKNTRVSSGAKIHHVGYLGDTVVGNDVNIGAGTITCNYDGAQKHETEIGEGAFIGSGTLLVAPVRVGSQAMTGAGSVVTRDVPAQAKAYGVPARVRGVRALPADAEQDGAGEKKGA